jgi:hypothetical protein
MPLSVSQYLEIDQLFPLWEKKGSGMECSTLPLPSNRLVGVFHYCSARTDSISKREKADISFAIKLEDSPCPNMVIKI